MLKAAIVAVFLFGLVADTLARDTTVRGYTRRDGTYVAPHHRSTPNDTRLDNYSTRGNVNPYTGREGTVDPYVPRNSSGARTSESLRPLEPLQPLQPLRPYGR